MAQDHGLCQLMQQQHVEARRQVERAVLASGRRREILMNDELVIRPGSRAGHGRGGRGSFGGITVPIRTSIIPHGDAMVGAEDGTLGGGAANKATSAQMKDDNEAINSELNSKGSQSIYKNDLQHLPQISVYDGAQGVGKKSVDVLYSGPPTKQGYY